MDKKIAVVAIGGNSLIKSRDRRTIEDQYLALAESVEYIVDLIELDYHVVISHGNGPQVGFIMLRSEIARREAGLHIVPLEIAVADTQGSIGHQIEVVLNNALIKKGYAPRCISMVTQVRVDKNDPGFMDPQKPVGEFYTETQIQGLKQQHPDWVLKEDANRGWRRVVASPKPVSIVEMEAVSLLVEAGYYVVTCGGGGIPVIEKGKGLIGVDAVIDKDLTSCLLGNELGAELLIISTAVEQVALNFGKPDQKPLGRITVDQAQRYIDEGHFAPGSMLPKIQAALRFIENGGKEVIITSPEFIKDAITEGRGTHVVAYEH